MDRVIALFLMLTMLVAGCATKTASSPDEGSQSTSGAERSKNSKGGGGGY